MMNPSQNLVLPIAALIAVVLSASSNHIRADESPANGQRPQWEYRVDHFDYRDGLVDELNRLGNEGWELVQFSDGKGIFKRMKTAPDQMTRSGVQIELTEDRNVIILRGKNEDVKAVADSIRRIDEHRDPSQRSDGDESQDAREQRAENTATNSTREVTKYRKMEKRELQEELRRLQEDVLAAERVGKQAKEKASAAAKAYQSASDEEKADALLGMIEADAASRPPIERYTQACRAFEAAQRAYLQLLLSEERAPLRAKSIPDAVERGMQLDAIERQQRLLPKIELKPVERK